MSNADPMDKWDGTNASVCRKCRGGEEEGDDRASADRVVTRSVLRGGGGAERERNAISRHRCED